ncbi:MAG: TMEM143 family protein [Nostocales cyanobacterium 94392]|nr:TMEM143 family protein [Nostocales cyanobacterium 94392]
MDDNQLNAAETQKFKDFCEILSSYYHFRFHKTLEVIKDNYVPFNPNADVEALVPPSFEQYDTMESSVVDGFEHILSRANYIKLSEDSVKESLGKTSLIDLKTEVDFDDFDRFICYYRGDSYKTIMQKKLLFWKQEKRIDIFERIVLLIKFKEAAYFRAKKDKRKERNFIPGKMYVYFYKNIPKLDIDLLFPNVTTSMTWKDRLLFGIPAIGAAIPLILRALPNILLLVAAILFALNAEPLVEQLEVEQNQVRDIMPVLVATLSLGMALGGFAFKQYSNYKSKRIKFQKDVTETLFFKNLGNNDSVFQTFIDLAEEEECKEIILVYYHLMISNNSVKPEELDTRIEAWMKEKLGTTINFDIHGPLDNLANIRGKVIKNSVVEDDTPLLSLLNYDKEGFCNVLPLDDAKKVIDYVWDNAFNYNGITL